ncbi:pre-rRNA-processing protein ESF1-like [Phragmites australis]|uniref:pre-rRNA-processing protein ESF1-like n=1 Tax=Phragmites australis TaxID=29695 RepID=UPI002D774340|nr:pre-rRNA-processing protein ESF1-like [Phragmites australis]
MAPPASSDEPARHKKAKKSKFDKEKKKHKKKNQENPTTDAAQVKRRKHKDGRDEKQQQHSKKYKKERKPEGKASEGEEVEGGRAEKMKRAMEDERFAAARTDPRFRPMRRKEAKVALDSRFSSMMTDPRFASSAAPVDKRGKRRKKGARDNPMLHYYLTQDEEEEGKEKGKEKEKFVEQKDEEDVEEDEEQEEEESSSSDDDEDEDVDDDEYSVGSDIAHYLMGRHDDTPMIDKETHRLAVVNMDWDHIKAVDLYMVMTSCIPKGGRVLSVSIYPSEFGLKCLEIESTQGPAALVDANVDDNDDDNDEDNDEDEDNSDYDDDDDENVDSDKENNKLRAYELNRLRYYYAVVVCDSSATANHLYTTLDGTEFLKTANVFDLQFISDSMEFKHPARDVATEAPPSYKEPDFETRALQHSRVKLTWDDDEPERKKVLRRKFTDDQLDDLDMYLASDDSASDEAGVDNSDDDSLPNGGCKQKLTKEEMLALLLQGDKSDEEQTDGQDMEITFNTELEDLSKRILERKSNEEKTVWEKHQEKMKEKRKARKRGLKDDDDYNSEDEPDEDDDFFAEEQSDEETKPIKSKKQKAKIKDKAKGKGKDKPLEEYMEQEATKEELELLVAGDQDTANGAKGYNLKRKKSKKGKKGKEVSAEDNLPDIDLSKDERFSAMFTSHLFALDPTDPQYKRSAPFMRKQAGKQGGHAGNADREPPVEGSSMEGKLPPDDAAATKNDDQKSDGASTEKLQILSAVKSLKRNLGAFKNASTGDR